MAQYDLDELDLGKNETVNIDSTVLNKIVDIPEFDCSRKEVEVSLYMPVKPMLNFTDNCTDKSPGLMSIEWCA